MEIGFFDRQGEPMTLQQWAHAKGNLDYQTVKVTEIAPDVRVISMWHGLDPDPFRKPPHIFGSIIFAHGQYLDREEVESPTREEALAAHAELVVLARLRFGP